MNVLSLFDGISCGQVALNRAGIKYDKYFASEIKKDAIKVTKDNYPNTIQLGDVTKIGYADGQFCKISEKGEYNTMGVDFMEDIDLLMGGSPCQDFSAANMERLGLEGAKSSLFYEWVRLWKETKPKYFLLENVGSMDSEDALTISKILGVGPVNINSSLVSAQLRDRLYWTNIPGFGRNLFGTHIDQPEDKKIKLQDILESGYTDREKARAILESDSRPLRNPQRMIHRYIETGMTTVIFENKDLMEKLSNRRIGWQNKHEIEIKKEDVRYFTQTELEELQTLPKGYTKVLTRDKAAGCIGDGWTVDVIVHIFKGLAPQQTTG